MTKTWLKVSLAFLAGAGVSAIAGCKELAGESMAMIGQVAFIVFFVMFVAAILTAAIRIVPE